MAIDPEIANPAALGYIQNALAVRRQQAQQDFSNNLALRDQGLQEQQFTTQQNALKAQQGVAQQKMNAEQALAGSRIVQMAAQKGQDPKAVAEQIAPNFVQDFESQHGQGSWAALQPNDVLNLAKLLEQKSMAQLGQSPEVSRPTIGAVKPEDFTPESLAKYQQSGNPNDLVRYQAPRQDAPETFSPQTLADGSIALVGNRGTIRKDTGLSGRNPNAMTDYQRQQLALEEQKLATSKATNPLGTQAQNAQAYQTFQTAIAGVQNAMKGTETGPIAGRLPAITTAQQTAEGAVSAMAPVLKQIFRIAGEGTFTDKDQELLMKMVPTRTDTPEARTAKIANIDKIVRSKLGIDSAQSQQSPVRVSTPQEALQLAPGTKFITPDGRVKVR